MHKYFGLTLVFVLGFAAVAPAQVSTDNAYQVRYTEYLSKGDSRIRIVNTGARGGVSGAPGPGGEICTNVYAFAPNGQMKGCCTCLVPPDGLVALSVRDTFLPNKGFKVTDALVIKLLATVPVAATCPGASTVNVATLAPGMASWVTTLDKKGPSTETPFTPSTLSASELNKLAVQCAFINGGPHFCPSCPAP